MKVAAAALLAAALQVVAAPAFAGDPGHIDGYVTPYYESTGPVIRIGAYSNGLASTNDARFVATVVRMKHQWDRLSFVDLYVAAIRLYDMGYRNEATYWFYSAQYKGRQFALLVDQQKLGTIGSPGFELYHAQDAFFEVAGPDINGYAFKDIDALVGLIRKVQDENKTVGDLQGVYPGVAFKSRSQWQAVNGGLNDGLGRLANQLRAQKTDIAQERRRNGTEARFARLTSKPFPGGF